MDAINYIYDLLNECEEFQICMPIFRERAVIRERLTMFRNMRRFKQQLTLEEWKEILENG